MIEFPMENDHKDDGLGDRDPLDVLEEGSARDTSPGQRRYR